MHFRALALRRGFVVNSVHTFNYTHPPSPHQTEEDLPPPRCMETTIESLTDGTWKVVVKADGYEETGWVTSHHLVRPKETQLMHTIYRKAQQDFFGDSSPCDI